MNNPPPLFSYGTKNIGDKPLPPNSRLSGAVEAIFNKFLNETSKNPMSVGGRSVQGVSKDKIIMYQPHNYRLYIEFSKIGLVLPEKEGLYTRGSVTCKFRIINSVEPSFEVFFDCRVVVHKKTIEITNKIDSKNWYPISLGSRLLIEEQVRSIIKEKDEQCFKVLKEFIRLFGGSSSFKIVNFHSEEKIMNEDSIDMIPRKMKFHSPTVKKVYNEPNVEFNDSVSVVNYLEARSLESITPDLVSAFKLLAVRVLPPLQRLKEGIVVLDDLFTKSVEVKQLSYTDRLALSEWLGVKFGGVAFG